MMPESSAAAWCGIRRKRRAQPSSSALRLVSSDVTLLCFSRGDDADDFFAIFIPPVKTCATTNKAAGVGSRSGDLERDPPLLAVIVDTIPVNKTAIMFEGQPGSNDIPLFSLVAPILLFVPFVAPPVCTFFTTTVELPIGIIWPYSRISKIEQRTEVYVRGRDGRRTELVPRFPEEGVKILSFSDSDRADTT